LASYRLSRTDGAAPAENADAPRSKPEEVPGANAPTARKIAPAQGRALSGADIGEERVSFSASQQQKGRREAGLF
jgi:hypothetical protein